MNVKVTSYYLFLNLKILAWGGNSKSKERIGLVSKERKGFYNRRWRLDSKYSRKILLNEVT